MGCVSIFDHEICLISSAVKKVNAIISISFHCVFIIV